MLDLTNSPLLKNVPDLNNELTKWQQDLKMITGRDNLAKMIAQGDIQSSLFNADDCTPYALMAYQNKQISLAQFSSIALFWSAFADYGKVMSNIQLHLINRTDRITKKLLESYLQVEEPEILNVDYSLPREIVQGIFDELLSAEVPQSERYFMTFTLENREDLAPILSRIKEIGFTLFMPKDNGKGCEVIVPSFSLLQTAIKHITPGKVQLVPRIGEDTLADIQLYHKANQHPLGLSIPGYEHTDADGYRAKRLGFALHDAPYHVVLVSFIPFLSAIDSLIELGNEYIAMPGKNNIALTTVVTRLTDAEFRKFTSSSNFKKLLGHEDQKILNHPESNFLMVIARALVPAMRSIKLHKSVLKKKTNIEKLSEERKNSIQGIDENSLPLLRGLITYWIINLLRNGDIWQQKGINIKELIKFLDASSKESEELLNSLLDGIKNASLFSREIPELMLKCVREVQACYRKLIIEKNDASQQFIASLNENKNSWLMHYLQIREKLFKFAKQGDWTELEKMLSDSSFSEYLDSVDITDEDMMTPFHWAVKNGHVKTAGILLDYGADVNRIAGIPEENFRSAPFGTRALHIASKNSDKEMVAYLLKRGAKCIVYDQSKCAPVDYSIEQGDVDIIHAFINKATVGETHIKYLESKNKVHEKSRLFLAEYSAFKKRLQLIKNEYGDKAFLLLQELTKDNSDKFSLSTLIESGWSMDDGIFKAQHYEIDWGCYFSLVTHFDKEHELQFLLTQKNFDVNMDSTSGKKSLSFLLDRENLENPSSGGTVNTFQKIQMLIKAGTDVNLADENNKKPLTIALSHYHTKAVRLLLESKATVSKQDDLIEFIFQLRQRQSKNKIAPYKWPEDIVEIFKLLIEYGCDLNAPAMLTERTNIFSFQRKMSMQTAWSMIRNAKVEMSNVFSIYKNTLEAPLEIRVYCLEHGANPNQPDAEGIPELTVALRNNWLDYAKLLIEKGHKTDTTDENGNSALHLAAAAGKSDMVKLLLERNAPQTPNLEGKTPCDLALLNKHISCAKLFDPTLTLASSSLFVSTEQASQNPRSSGSASQDLESHRLRSNKLLG